LKPRASAEGHIFNLRAKQIIPLPYMCRFIRENHCLLLIALEAILNTGRQCILAIYSLVGIFVPSGLIPFRLCCGLLQPIIIFFGQSSGICMLMIAADRLCAILVPTWLESRIIDRD
jgi:hypothetical protein